jgi:hypothetical protein
MVAKYTEKTPGVSPEHLALLERKRASWHKCYGPVREARDNAKKRKFLATYPDWYELRDEMPEQWVIVIESYYGIDTERLTTTEIGYELHIDGKPRSRQAIHLILKKAIAWLDNPEGHDKINKNPKRNRSELLTIPSNPTDS